jgi:polyisoprenoid-binding protein YceI
MTRSTLLVLAASLALAACDNKPTQDKPVAKVAEPVAVPKGEATGTAYAFSNAGSKIGFVGAKVTGKHEGSFGTFTGTVRVPDGDVTKGSVTVSIDIASLTTDNERLTGHLKSDEIFDAAKFPKASFTSTSVKAGGEKGATHTITGNLELHGVTKSITFPATVKVAGDKVDVDSELGINRKDFGLVYPGKPDDLIKDEVLIKLTIRASKSLPGRMELPALARDEGQRGGRREAA